MSSDNIQLLYRKTIDGNEQMGLMNQALMSDLQRASETDGPRGVIAFVSSVLFGVVASLDHEKQRELLGQLGWEAVARVDTSTVRPV